MVAYPELNPGDRLRGLSGNEYAVSHVDNSGTIHVRITHEPNAIDMAVVIASPDDTPRVQRRLNENKHVKIERKLMTLPRRALDNMEWAT